LIRRKNNISNCTTTQIAIANVRNDAMDWQAWIEWLFSLAEFKQE